MGYFGLKGKRVDPALRVKIQAMSSRERDGRINSSTWSSVFRFLDEHSKASRIVHLVHGSKSGIEDDLALVEAIGDRATCLVDICQFRSSRALVTKLIKQNALVLLTGSKFFQAPPFCGILLVPKSQIERNSLVSKALSGEYSRIFSRYDLPPILRSVNSHFSPLQNIALRARLHVALSEMEEYYSIPECNTQQVIEEWHTSVTTCIHNSDFLKLFVPNETTTRSIISFRVLSRDQKRFFDGPSLSALHKKLHVEGVRKLGAITIGQPVSYPGGSFLRLAIGSEDVRNACHKTTAFRADELLVQGMERLAFDMKL